MTKRLGLHIDPASIDGASKGVDWGEQTATFWACYRLDRNLAMMLGRACHMTWIDVSLPRPLGLIPPETLHSQRLSTELVYACHIEHAHLQDLCFARL